MGFCRLSPQIQAPSHYSWMPPHQLVQQLTVFHLLLEGNLLKMIFMKTSLTFVFYVTYHSNQGITTVRRKSFTFNDNQLLKLGFKFCNSVFQNQNPPYQWFRIPTKLFLLEIFLFRREFHGNLSLSCTLTSLFWFLFRWLHNPSHALQHLVYLTLPVAVHTLCARLLLNKSIYHMWHQSSILDTLQGQLNPVSSFLHQLVEKFTISSSECPIQTEYFCMHWIKHYTCRTTLPNVGK